MSDNELDAELLALAGGGDSSDDDQASNDEATAMDDAEESLPSTRRAGGARKSSPKSRKRPSRAVDSAEEGEASGHDQDRANGHGSASDGDDDQDLYPVDGIFRSEAEKTEIMGMTEIQREELLAERAAEVQRRTQDQQLNRLLQARKLEQSGADDRKRKAGAADLDDGHRKSGRAKTKATDTLDAYKRQRELKGAQKARGQDARRDDRSPSQDDTDDRRGHNDSEVEWDDSYKRASPRSDEPRPVLRDFQKCHIGRAGFAKICCYPTFEDALTGCYCRVSVGSEGNQAYRMALIKGFKQAKPYLLDTVRGRKVYTDQYVNLVHGKTEKVYPFAACSNQTFTDADLAQYEQSCNDMKSHIPSRRQVYRKVDDINAILDYTFTDADIQYKITKAKEMENKFHQYGRDRIVRRREDAMSRGDKSVVARCDGELADYDSGLKPVTKVSAQDKPMNQQDRLAALNKANRKANSEQVRKAQLAEKQAQQKSRGAAAARAKLQAQAAAAVKNEDDLFGPDEETAPSVKDVSRHPSPVKKEPGYGGMRKKNMDDDILASMDLGIEIDI